MGGGEKSGHLGQLKKTTLQVPTLSIQDSKKSDASLTHFIAALTDTKSVSRVSKSALKSLQYVSDPFDEYLSETEAVFQHTTANADTD